jgi:hypothetical protein
MEPHLERAMRRLALFIPLCLAATSSAVAQAGRTTADQRQAVTITVYNQNFGLVREVRAVELARGQAALEFRDVASQIEP